jgi:AraC family transcriptional activator of pobA
MEKTLETKEIAMLRVISDLIPVSRESFQHLPIRVFDGAESACGNYLSPNRREFYKVMMITEGVGLFTIGINTYHIDQPTLLFFHPSDIISWRNRAMDKSEGYCCLFNKDLVERHPILKATISRYDLFTDKSKSVMKLSPENVTTLTSHFRHMQAEEQGGGKFIEDAMQAWLQLLIIESARIIDYPRPDHVSEEYRHVHEFFRLLEEEIGHINYSQPITIRTAKEFAASLSLHPNYLNELLKKHTGQNVSTHIRDRLLEEAKTLLIQTEWSVQDIGYSLGFAEQSNFNLFFKKNAGIPPAAFRKSLSTPLNL